MDITKCKICFKYKKETWVSVDVKAIRWKIDWWGTRHSRGAKESPHTSRTVTREKMFFHNRDSYHDPHSLIKFSSITSGRWGAAAWGSQPDPGKVPAANGPQALQCDFQLIVRGTARAGRKNQTNPVWGEALGQLAQKVNPNYSQLRET